MEILAFSCEIVSLKKVCTKILDIWFDFLPFERESQFPINKVCLNSQSIPSSSLNSQSIKFALTLNQSPHLNSHVLHTNSLCCDF